MSTAVLRLRASMPAALLLSHRSLTATADTEYIPLYIPFSVDQAVSLPSARCWRPVHRPSGPSGPRELTHVVRLIAHWSGTQGAATYPFVPGHRPISVLPLLQRCAAGIPDLDNIARIGEVVVPRGVLRAQI